ncbi:MAG: putative tRNA-dihydrouridine synthase [Chlamydiae bacterium]|nr:putative tRNA-dihydrouridine synthase [Chlamydiota bacterium]
MKRKSLPFTFGTKTFPNPIFYAPLAGCSDFPFRQMSAKYHPGLMFCEMVKMDALVRYDQNTLHLLDYQKDMRSIGGQICGNNPKIAGKAAKIIEELGFDVVDLNCGCPVDKVTKDGSGSGMLKDPELIGEVLASMVAAVSIPVTVKIRAGWDEEQINAPLITQIAEKAGAKAITVHGRTRQQAYRGVAKWDHIKTCKQVANEIKVIGNGDLFDAPAAKRMFDETGCDAVLVSRGTMGQPWIVEDILRVLEGLPPIKRTTEDCRQALLEHLQLMTQYYSQRQTILNMRKVGCWYIKKSAQTRSFRGLISKAASLEEIRDLISEFPLSEG